MDWNCVIISFLVSTSVYWFLAFMRERRDNDSSIDDDEE